jgi:hypothetical protein
LRVVTSFPHYSTRPKTPERRGSLSTVAAAAAAAATCALRQLTPPRRYTMAEEFPLVLHGCGYANVDMSYSPACLWRLTSDLEHEWETLTLKAARIRNAINFLSEVHDHHRS